MTWYFFSQYSRKCKFDEDGDIQNYTLDHLKAYSTKQKTVYNDNENDKECCSGNASNDNFGGNSDDNNDSNELAGKEQ